MERSLRRRRVAPVAIPEAHNADRKRGRKAPPVTSAGEIAGDGIADDFFDRIPDDLLIIVLSKLSSTASCPSDFINALSSYVLCPHTLPISPVSLPLSSLLSISHQVDWIFEQIQKILNLEFFRSIRFLSRCKRFHFLCLNNLVLSKACVKLLAVKEKNWSESAHRFLWRCTLTGNLEACYVLGMIRFYCLGNRVSGISLMAKAAIGFHAPALYSLAVIQFNGSGSSKKTKDLYAGVAFCARAASLGHLDALREFGHCLQDGYGVRQNVLEGRRCLIHANYSEITGTAKTAAEPHPVNRFMAEWFAERLGALGEEDLRLCSNKGCGRRETRRHEFRRCSMCGAVNYCSRVCQAMDWKISHKMECTTWFFREQPLVDVPGGGADGDTGGPLEQAAAAGGVMEQGAV